MYYTNKLVWRQVKSPLGGNEIRPTARRRHPEKSRAVEMPAVGRLKADVAQPPSGWELARTAPEGEGATYRPDGDGQTHQSLCWLT